jgi:hypothetical protein
MYNQDLLIKTRLLGPLKQICIHLVLRKTTRLSSRFNIGTISHHLRSHSVSLSHKSPHMQLSVLQPSPPLARQKFHGLPITPSPLGVISDSCPQETPAPVPIVPSEPPAPRLLEPELQVVESPPNLVDSPHAHESILPVIERASGKLSDYVETQPTVTKAPDMTSQEILEEIGSVRPQTESGFESTNEGFGIYAIRVEEPKPEPVTIPTRTCGLRFRLQNPLQS